MSRCGSGSRRQRRLRPAQAVPCHPPPCIAAISATWTDLPWTGSTTSRPEQVVAQLADVVELLVPELAQCPVEVRQNPARIRNVDVRVLAGDASRLRGDNRLEGRDSARADAGGRTRLRTRGDGAMSRAERLFLRHHRPGRLVPRRAAAWAGVRRLRHGPPPARPNFERIEHLRDASSSSRATCSTRRR